MTSNLEERFEKFSSCFVDEFEMYIEVQRVIIEGETPSNAKISGIATNSIEEIFNSPAGVVGKTLSGVKDYVLHQRQLDIAGKIIKLINKYRDPEQKKAIRAILVRVSFELFRSYEYQFMNAEKSQGGWSQAMVQLARTAVWCFMHYYKFNAQEELDEKCVLEGVTLKNMPDVRTWKKWYYREGKNFTKVTNTGDHVKFDGVKMYSKVGLILDENQAVVCYKNDITKPEKYGARLLFSHETTESIKTDYEAIDLPASFKYQYQLNKSSITKETMCKKMFEKINSLDGSFMEDRILENTRRITTNIIENFMCEIMQQIVSSLNEIAIPAATSSVSTVNNETTNSNFFCQKQEAEKIQNIYQGTFNDKVVMNF